MTSAVLPSATHDEMQHSARLMERIVAEINAGGGWISFERFMEMALYSPGLGYYSAGAMKFGKQGDFLTAPEISPVFGQCIASQCLEVLQNTGGGILELGAGSGALAVAVLRELADQDRLPDQYLILEVSADLKQRQQQRIATQLPHLFNKVAWLDAWPVDLRGVVLANEVLDALPVQRFRIRGTQVMAVGVMQHQGRLVWSETPADPLLETAVRALEGARQKPFAEGYLSELNLRIGPWMRSLAQVLVEGVALFIDYGLPRHEYYSDARQAGTLLCHYRHRAHADPLILVGVQDIGAWVDFSAVADAASEAGLRIAGFATQAHFLIGCGLDQHLAHIAQLDAVQRVQLTQQVMTLTMPGEMGERCKVLALAAHYDHPLRGFSMRDLGATL